MVESLLEAHTEWIEEGLNKHDFCKEQIRKISKKKNHGKLLKWVCPNCEGNTYTNRRFATKGCYNCDRIMQAKNYNADAQNPDPNNPKPFLRSMAKRRGFPHDHYYPDEDRENSNDPLKF